MPEDPNAPLAWLEWPSHYGVDHAGNLEPLCEFAVHIAVPQLSPTGVVLPTGSDTTLIPVAEELGDETPIRIIPDTRIVETRDLRLASALVALGFVQIGQPTAKYLKDARDETAAHVDAMAKRDRQVAIGNEPAPDATDPGVAGQAPPASGAVRMPSTAGFAMSAEQRAEIDRAIREGDIDSDEALAAWVSSTPVGKLLEAIGDDDLLALRVHIAETDRADARTSLLEPLAKLLTTKTED